MNVLAILGAMEALCSFELVLEGKTRKEIAESSRLEFLEKFLAKNVALSDAEDSSSGLLKKVSIADSLLLRILSNSPKVPRAKFLGRDELLRFSSICKFCRLKNPFTKIT